MITAQAVSPAGQSPVAAPVSVGLSWVALREPADDGAVTTATDTTPTDTAPTGTVPTDTVPTDTMPTDTMPTDTVPTDTGAHGRQAGRAAAHVGGRERRLEGGLRRGGRGRGGPVERRLVVVRHRVGVPQ
ncbi:MAG: hypothetical protein ACKOSO_08070 [Actinomycetota bacterium]